MTDQQRADALGCSGGWLETPHLDGIAAGGVRFEIKRPQPLRPHRVRGGAGVEQGCEDVGVAVRRGRARRRGAAVRACIRRGAVPQQLAHGGGVACGSCGFHLPHGSLPHQAAEQAQVEALEPAERELQWADESIDADNWDTSSPSVMGGADDVWEATEDVASPDGDSAKGWGSNDPWAKNDTSSGSDGGGGDCSSCGGGCGS